MLRAVYSPPLGPPLTVGGFGRRLRVTHQEGDAMRTLLRLAAFVPVVGILAVPAAPGAQPAAPADAVTFSKDIAPILERSCVRCHRPDGVAPMSLVTYEDARPWARSMKRRT